MKSYILEQFSQKLLFDSETAISAYLKLRDHFPYTCLFEHSEYGKRENDLSIIAFEPLAEIELKNELLRIKYPNGQQVKQDQKEKSLPGDHFEKFNSLFQSNSIIEKVGEYASCLYGYMAYDLVQNLESIDVKNQNENESIPLLSYRLYRYHLIFDHAQNECHLIENEINGDRKGFKGVLDILKNPIQTGFPFETIESEDCNTSESEFLEILAKGKEHCQLGDVFQIVLSRKYSQKYQGDDFNVFRALRSVNPSPYLFYFDFGNFKIFGSSPESQLITKDNKALLHPIAGTFRTTGNEHQDQQIAENLLNDPKENAEHNMLVDLARNDLSVYCSEVEIETFKELQHYSHVVHLVSKVSAELSPKDKPGIISSTFPAGTLSGAPKVRAMELINEYEIENRQAYGGAIGRLALNGDFNHAIIIRSFLSKDNCLFYQAGAGVVSESNLQCELQEVENKLKALRVALKTAVNI